MKRRATTRPVSPAEVANPPARPPDRQTAHRERRSLIPNPDAPAAEPLPDLGAPLKLQSSCPARPLDRPTVHLERHSPRPDRDAPLKRQSRQSTEASL